MSEVKEYHVSVRYDAIVTTESPDYALDKALAFDGVITELQGHGEVIEWEAENE